MIIMQLMRLPCASASIWTSRGLARKHDADQLDSTAPPIMRVDDALTTLMDAAKRADPARRASRLKPPSRPSRATSPRRRSCFLCSPNPPDAAQKAVQDYFDKPWLRQPLSARSSSRRRSIASLSAGRGRPDPVRHASTRRRPARRPTSRKTAKSAESARSRRASSRHGRRGTPVRDLDNWIAHGESTLAVLAVRERVPVDTTHPASASSGFVCAPEARPGEEAPGFDRPVSAYDHRQDFADGGARPYRGGAGEVIKPAAVWQRLRRPWANSAATNCRRQERRRNSSASAARGPDTLRFGSAQTLKLPPAVAKGVERVVKVAR